MYRSTSQQQQQQHWTERVKAASVALCYLLTLCTPDPLQPIVYGWRGHSSFNGATPLPSSASKNKDMAHAVCRAVVVLINWSTFHCAMDFSCWEAMCTSMQEGWLISLIINLYICFHISISTGRALYLISNFDSMVLESTLTSWEIFPITGGRSLF
jgi:hypothetical protein